MVKRLVTAAACVFAVGVVTVPTEGRRMSETIIATLADTGSVLVQQNVPLETTTETIPADTDPALSVRIRPILLEADQTNPNTLISFALERRVAPEWRHVCGHPGWQGTSEIDSETGLIFRPECSTGVSGLGAGGAPSTKRNWRVRGWAIPLSGPMTIRLVVELVLFE